MSPTFFFFFNFYYECFESFKRERERERGGGWVDSDVMEKDCEIKKGKIKG